MALAAFSIIMLVVAQSFGRGFVSYRETKKAQASLETAHFALNLIAKELRTSSIIPAGTSTGATTSRIKFYDYSQKRCIEYVFTEGAGGAATGQVTRRDQSFASDSPEQNRTDCENHTFGGAAQSLVTRLASQEVRVTPSDPLPTPNVGRATFALTIGSGSNATIIQTTVSLRDFNYTSL